MPVSRSFLWLVSISLLTSQSLIAQQSAQSSLDSIVKEIARAFDERDSETLFALSPDWLWESEQSDPEIKSRLRNRQRKTKWDIDRFFRVFERYNISLKAKPVVIEKLKKGTFSNMPAYHVKLALQKRDFAQFSFELVSHKSEFYLDGATFLLKDPSEVGGEELMSLLEFTEDQHGNLLLQDSLKLSDKGLSADTVALSVMSNSMFYVIDTERSTNADGHPTWTGVWGGQHFSSPGYSFLGVVHYTFEYSFSEDTMHFRYYDFKHDKKMNALTPNEPSKFVSAYRSMGALTLHYNRLPPTAMTQTQYLALLNDVKKGISEFVGLLKIRASSSLAVSEK